MFRRSYYPRRYGKYSNETMCFNAQVTSTKDGGQSLTGENPIVIVPATTVLGNRKVKNFSIKVTANLNDDSIIGVLAYVPEGTEMSIPLVTGPVQSLYEPNQNVIATFVIPPNCTRLSNGTLGTASAPTQIVVSNRLARNLNTGDSIQLFLISPNGITAGTGTEDPPVPECTICGTVNYSIKY